MGLQILKQHEGQDELGGYSYKEIKSIEGPSRNTLNKCKLCHSLSLRHHASDLDAVFAPRVHTQCS